MKYASKICSVLLAAALCGTPVSALTLPVPPVKATAGSMQTTPAKAASTPAGTLELALEALKAVDAATFNRYTDNIGGQNGSSKDGIHYSSNKMLWDEKYTPTEAEKELTAETFKALSWTLSTAAVNGDTATISAKITNADLRSLVKETALKALKNPPTGDDDEAWEQEIRGAIQAAQKTTVTNEVTVTLKKAGGIWKVQLDDSLVNALFGGLLEGVESLFSDGTMEAILNAAFESAGGMEGWLDMGLSTAGDAVKDGAIQKEVQKAVDEAGREVQRALEEADIAGEIERALRDALR